jgi:crotonobetainyl-CoA:carnitine CoA-transferase CaiB-like acyl-CoA transferase
MTSERADPPALLDDIRVLDLTGQLGQYATKLLADMGADVIRVEPPAGSPARTQPPFYHDQPDENRSLDFWYFNTNKRSLTLNLHSEDGQEILRRLLAAADVLVESFPPQEAEALLPSDEELRELNPRLVHCSITGFGTWGPHADYVESDLIGLAMSGVLTLSGFPDRPPTMLPATQAYTSAGIQAAQGILAALLQRDRSGHGQNVEVSMQEALSLSQETAMQFWDMRREIRKRMGDTRLLPGVGTYACQDGYVYMMVGVAGFGAAWPVLAQWMDEEGAAEDLLAEEWQALLSGTDLRNLTLLMSQPERLQEMMAKFAHVNEVLGRFLATKTKQELYEQGQRRRLLIGPVNSPKDLVENVQLNARSWYQQVPHPELGASVTYPGPPFRHSEAPWQLRRRPPLLGEHTAEILQADLALTPEQITALMGAGVI